MLPKEDEEIIKCLLDSDYNDKQKKLSLKTEEVGESPFDRNYFIQQRIFSNVLCWVFRGGPFGDVVYGALYGRVTRGLGTSSREICRIKY